jgi:hypothetical protein
MEERKYYIEERITYGGKKIFVPVVKIKNSFIHRIVYGGKYTVRFITFDEENWKLSSYDWIERFSMEEAEEVLEKYLKYIKEESEKSLSELIISTHYHEYIKN